MIFRKKTVSFIASGRGSNFKAVAEKMREGNIPGKLGILVTDRGDAGALELARDFGMQAYFINPKDFPDRGSHEEEMIRVLKKHKTDLVVAAGYMRLLTSRFLNEYKNRMINIHPALLPSFPGVHAQQQAFDYGVKITGCTAHFIDEGTDTGPIIMQAAVAVNQNDTPDSLVARILREEHRILPESVRLFCAGKLKVKGRKVIILP
jgi:phosphoribosylglycinamide formyltransferase 1